MQVNLSEYKMILQAISDLEHIQKEAEAEFNNYCTNITHCKDCPLYGIIDGCHALNYYDLKEKGVIK